MALPVGVVASVLTWGYIECVKDSLRRERSEISEIDDCEGATHIPRIFDWKYVYPCHSNFNGILLGSYFGSELEKGNHLTAVLKCGMTHRSRSPWSSSRELRKFPKGEGP